MIDKNLVKQYVDKIVAIIKADFEADAGERKSWQELCCWVNAYFQAEDTSDLTNKDLANMFLEGFPSITEANMLDYFEIQLEACEMDDKEEELEMLDSVVRRVEGFFAER